MPISGIFHKEAFLDLFLYCCTYLNCKVITMQMYTVLGTHASKTAIISTDKLGYFPYHQDLAITMPALGYWK